MFRTVERYFDQLMHYVDRMGMYEWIIVVAIAILIGLICMRGFGSQSHY